MALAEHHPQINGYRRTRDYTTFRPVGIFVPKLIRTACRRRGFINVDIVLRWAEIVGKTLSRYTWPMRIQWPRKQETILKPDGTEAPNTHRTRLVVGATPGKVLDVEYDKHAIMARVNTYLGYRAVTELQAVPDYSIPDQDEEELPYCAPASNAAPADGADALATALAKLGKAVKNRQH